MENFKSKYGCEYIWESDMFGEKGCEVCDINFLLQSCPKNCDKDGCYRLLSFDDLKKEKIKKHIKDTVDKKEE